MKTAKSKLTEMEIVMLKYHYFFITFKKVWVEYAPIDEMIATRLYKHGMLKKKGHKYKITRKGFRFLKRNKKDENRSSR